jgi:hypothetical protein
MSRKTGKPTYVASAASQSPAGNGKIWGLAGLIAVAVALGATGALLTASPSRSEDSIAAIRQEEAKRDTKQIVELTTMARNTKTVIMPVVTGLAEGKTASSSQLAAWKAVMLQETQRYAVTVSGTTATNVARGGFRNAVDLLSTTLDSYAATLALPAGQQQTMLEIVGRQRKLAVATWSVAATQLDQLNNDAGNGHQHVYLNSTDDGGAMTSDGAPEGKP